MSVSERTEHGQRTRAIIACQRLTLDRAERQELAEVLTGHAGSNVPALHDEADHIQAVLDEWGNR